MAFTQADLDAIDLQIKSGVDEIRFQDRTQKNRTLDELLKARQVIVDALSVGATGPNRQVRIYTSKGL